MTLLDPAFLTELEVLRRRLVIRARSGGAGEHLGRQRGGSAEFQEHRPYAPGDDLRRIDWAAYARTDEPVLKLFRTEEDALLRIVLDCSTSLGFGSPSKFSVAKRLSAALAYMMLASTQRAQLFAATSASHPCGPPVRGKAAVAAILHQLERVKSDGPTDLVSSVESVLQQGKRPGVLSIVSDFFDPGNLYGALDRAKAFGHDLLLIQVLALEEVEPSYEGDLTLEDCETGQGLDVTLDPDALEAYASRLAGLCEELRRFARSRGATYVRVRTDEALEPVVRRIVSRAID